MSARAPKEFSLLLCGYRRYAPSRRTTRPSRSRRYSLYFLQRRRSFLFACSLTVLAATAFQSSKKIGFWVTTIGIGPDWVLSRWVSRRYSGRNRPCFWSLLGLCFPLFCCAKAKAVARSGRL